MTPRQERFAQEYCVDLNAKQAAIRAGYSARGAKQVASRLLTYANVAAAIAKAQAERAERVEVTQDDVVRGLLLEARRTGDNATHGARVSAWATLAKHLGMDKLHHTGDITMRWADARQTAPAGQR